MFPLGHASLGSIPHIPWREDDAWEPVSWLLSVACCGGHGEAMGAPQPLVLSSGWLKLRVLKAPTCSHKVPTREGCIICLALVMPLCPSCRQCLRSVWGVGSSQEALFLVVQVCCPKPSSHSPKAWHEAASVFAHTSQTVMGISLWAASSRLKSEIQRSRIYSLPGKKKKKKEGLRLSFVEFGGTTSLRFRASPKFGKVWLKQICPGLNFRQELEKSEGSASCSISGKTNLLRHR